MNVRNERVSSVSRIFVFPADERLRLPPTPPSSHGSDSDGSQSPHSLPPLSPGHLQSPHSLPPSSPARLQARTSTAISSSPLLTAPHVSQMRFHHLTHHVYYSIYSPNGNSYIHTYWTHIYRVKNADFCCNAEAAGNIRPFDADRGREEDFDRRGISCPQQTTAHQNWGEIPQTGAQENQKQGITYDHILLILNKFS